MNLYWAFLYLLTVHWVADFVMQTHWQASNKSKDNWALSQHVGVYVSVLFFAWVVPGGTGAIAGLGMSVHGAIATLVGFILLNGALHWLTDWCTSRWSSKHFGFAFRDSFDLKTFTDQQPPGTAVRMLYIGDRLVDPGRHWHNFFVIVGFDQLIHIWTLGLTLRWFYGS